MLSEIVLFDDSPWRHHLLPLVATRPIADLRIGIMKISQKWSYLHKCNISFLTPSYLQEKFTKPTAVDGVIVRSNVLPTTSFIDRLSKLNVNEALFYEDTWVACRVQEPLNFNEEDLAHCEKLNFQDKLSIIRYPEDIFQKNKEQLEEDFHLLTKGRVSAPIPTGNQIYGDQIFIEESIDFKGVSLNAMDGPIYIGKGVVIEEGAYIKSHVALCDGVRVKTGANICSNVTVGPFSTVCGEINNTVIWGDSSKGHDGYLGCSVIGEGCNIGAGSANSNLRNDWKTVKLYDYALQDFRDTGLVKCGLIMGDHAMAGIQSAFVTGMVIGVGVQVAHTGFLPKFIPDFLWFTDKRKESYRWENFLDMLGRKSKVKNKTADPSDSRIFEYIFQNTIEIRIKTINTIQNNYA